VDTDASPSSSDAGSAPEVGGDAQSAGAGKADDTDSGVTPSNPELGADFDAARLLLHTRIRRLANAEYDASIQALLGTTTTPTAGPEFPPDLRQDGFTINADQRIDAVIVERLMAAADILATEAQRSGKLTELAACDTDGASSAELRRCARTFIERLAPQAYRRPIDETETDALLELYAVGAEDASYEDGIVHVLRGVLQSASFLYLTELGEGDPSATGVVELTPYELAASLSYLITSSPPDERLLEKAALGELSDATTRAREARRLLEGDARARDTTVRLVREWIGIDRIESSAKDSLVYPSFEAEKPRIVSESRDFVRAVAFESTGSISELFGATWTVDSGPLEMYETDGRGPIDGSSNLTDRVGILNQAAFLATYANAHESHPIFRGVAVAQRVTCMGLDSPASFNIEVVPPLPDPSLTTRERYTLHSQDAICAGCHDIIDPLGFSFEHFDGMGGYRDEDNGKPVDSSVDLVVEQEFAGSYADSNELALALSRSDTVQECFARYMFRAAAASGDSAATPGEAEFIEHWRALPTADRGDVVETLVAIVSNESFTMRYRL
jgi:hypothetical protein